MAISTKFLLFVGAALAVILLVEAFAYPYPQAPNGPPSDAPESRGYAGHGHGGRTKWQVYRGPNQHGYGKHGKFAPWGYYLTQPQDKGKHGYY